ncbi:MAG TPA: hypothetical protein VEA16_03485 [Vicinamibacterales bacterium]|nr:hypothetical protein [Vicinamibacterales bacterium]
MQKLGRQYVGQFNRHHQRTGTLWEGRYSACLVDDAAYLLRRVRYINLNPVRARMTDGRTRFPWSSCQALCGEHEDPLLTLHPTQQAQGPHPRVKPRPNVHCYGRDEIRATVEAKMNRSAAERPAHRPRRATL